MFRKASEVRAVPEFSGTPEAMGQQHGTLLRERIVTNLRMLVWTDQVESMLSTTDLYDRWVERQLELMARNWPWLLTEMECIASSAGLEHGDIFKLNFPVWSAANLLTRGQQKQDACACLALTLEDESIATASTLDDNHLIWTGPVKHTPQNGYGFVSMCVPGMIAGGRGINSQGLCIGTAAQGLDPRSLDQLVSSEAIPAGVALRVINQTCATVEDVREFCREHFFGCGLMCVDADGDILCGHQTPVGLFEHPTERGYAALGNSIADDRFVYSLYRQGYPYHNPEHPTSRFRRGSLLRFAESRSGTCTLEEAAAFVGTRNDDDLGSMHNAGTVAVTLGNPQNSRTSVWIRTPHNSVDGEEFLEYLA